MSTKDCFGHLHLYHFCKQAFAGITGKWCNCKLISCSWHYASLAQLPSQKLCPSKSGRSANWVYLNSWVSLLQFTCWPLVRVMGRRNGQNNFSGGRSSPLLVKGDFVLLSLKVSSIAPDSMKYVKTSLYVCTEFCMWLQHEQQGGEW